MTVPEEHRDQTEPSGLLTFQTRDPSVVTSLPATSSSPSKAVPSSPASSQLTAAAEDLDEPRPRDGLANGLADAQSHSSTTQLATSLRIPDQGSDTLGSSLSWLKSGSDGEPGVDESSREKFGQRFTHDWQDVQAAAGQAAVTYSAATATTSDSGAAEHNATPVAPKGKEPKGKKPPVLNVEGELQTAEEKIAERSSSLAVGSGWTWDMGCRMNLDELPNEVITHIFGYLEVCDLLATSRTNHHLRALSVQPILHTYRLHRARLILGPLLTSPSRPTLRDLIARHIFLTNTTQISRRLARNLVAIRLSRRLPQRPTAEALVQRGVLPCECVEGYVAPGLVARKRAVERERLKDGLRRWIDRVWSGEVRERAEGVRQWEETSGVGRVWKLRKFWERISRGEGEGVR